MSNRQAILHLGAHKTGTTALQAFLARNTDLLSEKGFYYRPIGSRWRNHHEMVTGFHHGQSLGREVLQGLIRDCGDRTLLISSEMLIEPFVDVDRFLRCLDGWNVRAIAYIRHPSDILVSAWNEVVRGYQSRWTAPIDAMPFPYDPGQFDLLAQWIGKTDLTLAPYDPRQWAGGSIFSDFLSMIGVDGRSFDYRREDGNESIAFPLAEALRLANMTIATPEQHAAIVAHLRTVECEPGPYPLKPESVEACLERMREILPIYRSLYRPGFQEDFLLQPRHSGATTTAGTAPIAAGSAMASGSPA